MTRRSPPTRSEPHVAADGLHDRVALDLAVDDEVARGGLRLERLHAAAKLHVGGRGREDGAAAVRDLRAHAAAAPPLPKLKSPIEIVIPNGFLPFISTTMRRPSWRDLGQLEQLLVAVDVNERLVAVDRLDVDVADRDLDLELDRLRRVEAMLGHLRSRGRRGAEVRRMTREPFGGTRPALAAASSTGRGAARAG